MKSFCKPAVCMALLWTSLSGAAQVNGGKFSASTLSGGINLRSIAGAPLSADVIKDFTQTLADGTQVPVETNGKMFRDSAGRMRTETELRSTAGGAATLHYVTILDPVAQLNVRLDPQTKTATLFPFPATPSQAAQAKLAKVLSVRNTQASRQPALVATQDLGASTLQGFAVTGIKRTVPAAANAPGSQRARNVVVESWFSPELQIELQSRTEDPKLGLSTTKLINIGNAEPDSALFQVPSDYAISDYTIKNNSLRK
ncbi:MAG TPA: hypothetical protein VGK22_16795 [Candidatus Angelobacter sp.]